MKKTNSKGYDTSKFIRLPSKKKLRPLGDNLLDLENVVTSMVEDHDLQFGDVLNLVYGYLAVHFPEAQEVYEKDNERPIFYYGPKEGLK